METKKRIYCIEGVWDWGDEYIEPSVEPMLQLIRGLGLWDYVRRDCATIGEFKHYIQNEWCEYCEEGSILYIASHGDTRNITFSDDQDLDLAQVATWLGPYGCRRCLVHFGGCNVLDDEDAATSFVSRTEAAAISGFQTEAYWTSQEYPPALALELMLFSSIFSQDVELGHRQTRQREQARKKLMKIERDLRRRFGDCKFRLLVPESV